MGCQDKVYTDRYGIDPDSSKLAPEKIADSFQVIGDRLSIQKDSLDKDFLFQANMVTLREAFEFRGKKSRIVNFSRRGQRIFMLESPAGHMVNEDYPMQLPLMEFDILSETETSLTLDINKGLSILYYSNDWYTHDSGFSSYEKNQPAAKVGLSYIDNMKLEQGQNLVIKQIVRLDTEYPGKISQNLEMRYYISPYHPDPSFVPTENHSIERFGFFEANPILKIGGGTRVNVSKWNIQKPIIYAISHNTPVEYREAVRRGALYWNTILGNNRIQVIEAPEGVTAPDFNYNVIQWVNYEQAGYAFADAQLDPRSGEILHAQVYMTSTFALSSREGVRSFLRRKKSKTNAPKTTIGLKGFEDQETCDIQHEEVLDDYLRVVSSPDLTDSDILRISQDYVTGVIAHEVGHTLGLRHNFAGSIALNVSLDEHADVFSKYVQEDLVPENYIPGSSVMDYVGLSYESLMGAKMRLGQTPLEYDQKAMEHLYLGKMFTPQDIPLFCTDGHVGTFVDCEKFDEGNSLVEFVKIGVRNSIDHLPQRLLESLISWKSEKASQGVHILESLTIPVQISQLALAPQRSLTHILQGSFRLLKIQRQYDYVGYLNLEDILLAQDRYLLEEFQKHGGISEVLTPFLQDKKQFVANKLVDLNKAIYTGAYQSGVTRGEKEFELTDSEISQIQNYAQTYFEKVFDELKAIQLSNWNNLFNNVRKDSLLADPVLEFLVEEQATVLTKEKSQGLFSEFLVTLDLDKKDETAGDLSKQEVLITMWLPQYEYDLELRVLAAKLFKSKKLEDPTLGIAESERAKEAYKARYDKILSPLDGFKFDINKQSRETMRWLMDEKKVSSAF